MSPQIGAPVCDSTAAVSHPAQDEAGLRAPVPRPGCVPRTALVNRLRAAGSQVITLLAPAGYGKTTVLAQWAARDERRFAWVTVDKDDPAGLCLQLAAALDRVERVEARVPRRKADDPARALAAAFFSLAEPVVLVVDGIDHLRSKDSADVVAALAGHVPEGSTLVLAGRALPRGPIARLRVSGDLFEVGTGELALSRREVDLLLRGLGVELSQGDLDELAARTEGWPAGLYLATLAAKDEGGSPAGEVAVSGDDRFVADYLSFECLSRLSAKDVRFLTRTAILDELSGPLCDAVLETTGSTRRLESLEQANLFLVPLDRRRSWYRYHREFRDFLRAELERREPNLASTLGRRASAWCEANGDPEGAIAYAHAAGDTDRLARLVGGHALAAWAAGKRELVETWLGWFDESAGLERYPEISVLEAWVHALRGRYVAAERWLAVAESSTAKRSLPDGSRSIEPWLAVIRAAFCLEGAEQMGSDAQAALDTLGPASSWRPTALVLRGAAHLLVGEDDLADAAMAEAAEVAESIGVNPSRIVALAERSILAASGGDDALAAQLATEAQGLVEEHGLEGYSRSAIAFAVSARREVQCGNLEQARLELERARALAPQLSRALPWYAVQTALELARVHLTLLDVAGARSWLADADAILRQRPGLGVLVARHEELGADVARIAKAHEGRASTLTAAELRLLPLLATHLSFREIGETLFVSRNTVKTQAISVYRKLGVSGRSEAIERAAAHGLLDARASVLLQPDFIRTG